MHSFILAFFGLILVNFLAGCSSAPTFPPPPTSSSPVTNTASNSAPTVTPPPMERTLRTAFREQIGSLFSENFSDTRAIEIYYATNRDTFGVTLGKEVTYGITKVNVPKRHPVGKIETTTDPREDTHKYFRVMQDKTLSAADWLDQIRKENQWGVLVFVHGFNVKYDEAIFRAAQLAYDLKFQGKVILWSWPAGSGSGFLDGKLLNRTYENNRKNAEATINQVSDFAKILAGLNIPVHVLVHSMGHQVIVPALAKITDDIKRPFIDELILNAPDIDSKQFENAVPLLKKISHRITLYCSYHDNAMVASQALNGGTRMGACDHVDGIDVVNVSEVDDPGISGLGHGYYSSRAILTDVFQVLLGLNADQRLFIRKSEPNATEGYILRP